MKTNHSFLRPGFVSYLAGFCMLSLVLTSNPVLAQAQDPVVENILKEGRNNSQLETLAHELLDRIGARLVGTPQMQQANDWAVSKYTDWGITARNEKWGDWKGWQRGISHIDMISPWVKSLEGNNWPGVLLQKVKPLPRNWLLSQTWPIRWLLCSGYPV